MKWLYGAGFSLFFSVVGLTVAVKNRNESISFLVLAIVLVVLLEGAAVHKIINTNLERSSKQDSEILELEEFWTSNWWE